MRRVGEVATTVAARADAAAPIGSTICSTDAVPAAWIETLFRRLREIYGPRWTAQLPDTEAALASMQHTWAEGLAGLPGEALRRGLAECVRRGEPWPPSLPEFRALCTGRGAGDQEWRAFAARCRAQAEVPVACLPAPAVERYGAAEAMRRIRDLLGGAKR